MVLWILVFFLLFNLVKSFDKDRKGSKIHKMRNEEGNSAAQIAFKKI